MKLKTGIALALLGMGAIITVSQPVVAAKGHHAAAAAAKRAGELEKLTEELGLTTDQQSQISAILKNAAVQRKAIRTTNPADKKAELKTLRQTTRKAIMDVLTADQKAKLKELRKARRSGGGVTATPSTTATP